MKRAETEIAASGNRVGKETDLPDLGVRILSDFGRIVAAEARLLEINLLGGAQAVVDRIYLASVLVVISAIGVIAIIGSMTLLLHQWMPWWQVLGIVGIVSLLLAEILRRTLMPANVPIYQVSTPRDNQ